MHKRRWLEISWALTILMVLGLIYHPTLPAYEAPTPNDLYLRIAQHPAPRLILTEALVSEIKSNVPNDARLRTYVNRTISMADQMVNSHDIGLRDSKGNETIFLSGGFLTLGMAWKITGDAKYATEAVQQIHAKILESSNWSNTNGLHMGTFLSGIAIGWDIFRDQLPTKDRSDLINKLKIIVDNYQKFYRSEMGSNNWVPTANHNWNPIFNSGYILLCLSMGDETSAIAPSSDPAISGLHNPKDYLDKAIENLPRYFNIMNPSGVDSEGVGYWMYGMIYGTMTLDGLVNATGSDLGLVDNSPGLKASCNWAITMTTPQGRHGIFSDPQDGWWGRSHFPLLWFAKRYGLNHLAQHNSFIWDKYYQGGTTLDSYPVFHALWHRSLGSSDQTSPPSLDSYFPSTDCPMAITRGSSNDSQAQWAYLKAGRITNHGHANQGGFMYEAMGVTWASDLGKDDYGISGYFSEPQAINSIYRKQTRAKSCLLIGDLINQKLMFSNDAPTTIRSFGVGDDGMQAVADLTPAYPRSAKVWRGMASMKGRKALLIQDEITLKSTDDIIWNMMTQDVSSFQLNGNTATLNKGGKQLKARILRPINAVFSLEDATPPTSPTGQNLNTTCKRLSIKLLQATGDQTIAVLLSPQWTDGERVISATDLIPLNSWETHIKSPQSLTFTGIPTKTYGDAAFLLSATTTSGLPISYVSSNTSVATVAGSLVTIKSAGTAIITATQNGDAHYLKSAPLSQTLTVNKATLTAVAYDKAKTVGMPNPPFDGFISGLKNSDSPSSIGLSITYTCAATTSSAVGGYPIAPSSSATLPNYSVVHKSGLLTISPKRIPVITWPTPSNITYGTALGASQLNATASISGTLSYTPTTGTILSAGNNKKLSVTFTPTDGNTYTTATGSTLITVTKKTLTVTGNSPSRSYGSTNPIFTLSYQGFVGSDNTSTLDILPVPTCSATITSPPGTYDIVVSGGSDDNYSMAPVKGTLTVTKAGQTISFGTLPSKDYGTGSITLSGTSNSGLPVTYTSSNSSVATITGSQVILQSAGTTVITATQTGDVNFLPAAPVSQTLVVNKASLTVTAHDKFRFLGTSNPAFDGFITGFKGSDTAAKIGLVVSFSCSATSTSIPGVYPITATGISATTNYHITYKSGQLTVSPKVVPVITWPNPDPMVFGTPLGSSQLNASSPIPGTFTYTPVPETILSAGNGLPLTVLFVPTDGEQYASVTRSVSITVTKKLVTATANSVSRPFGIANPALTLSYLGFAGDDTEISLDNPPTLSCGATASSPPGSYDISVVGGTDSNYTIASSKGTLTITKAGQTISFSPLAAKSYGDGTFSLAGTASSGLPVTYSTSNSTVATLSGQQVVIKSAGTTTITASQGGNANYLAAPSVFQTLTVKKAPLIVKANNLSRTLGAPNPAFSRSTTGFKDNDSTANVILDVGFTCSATPQSVIGDYPIVPSGPPALANYTVTYQTGILTITPKILPDITWDKPADIIYGTVLGASQLNATSTVSGTFTYSPSSGSLLPAGIERSLSVIFTPSDSTTYAPITRSVTLTVSKKPLAVTADSMTRAYGRANPEFTASYHGFIGTDTSATLDNLPNLTCNASTTSSPGAYSILVTGGSDENYAILPTNGTLTITKSPQIIDFSIIPSLSYGVGPIPLKASTSSGSPVAFSSSDPSVASIAGNLLVVNAAGTTTVTASQSGNINHLSANTSQVITVRKANLTVKATNQSRTRGTDNPKLVAQFTGLSKSDTADNIGLSLSLSCSATIASESGDYPILITGPGNTKNYLVSYTPGILTVTPKLVPEIIWQNPADITYGTVLSASQLNATASIPGVFTYDPPTGSLLQAGQGIRLSVEFFPQDETLYEHSFGTVEIAVLKAPLTIQAIDASRIAGSENPDFSFSFSGFMNNESSLSLEQQPIIQCSATPADPPGFYAIIPSGATSANYVINYTEGILTILPPPNSPPRAIDQSYTVISGESLQFMLLGNDTEGSISTYDYQQPRHGTLTGTQGLVTYQANDNFEGTDSFTFTVTDDDGLLSPSAMVNIVVLPRPTSDTTSSTDAGATAIKGPNSNSCGLGSGISVFVTTCLAFMSLVRRRRSSSLQS